MLNGALGVFVGTMAYVFLGPGIISYGLIGAGAWVILSGIYSNTDKDWELLCDNVGLYMDGEGGRTLYPKKLSCEKTKTGERWVLTLPYGLTTIDFEKVLYRLEQYYDADIYVEYKNKNAILEIHTVKLPTLVYYEELELEANEWIIGKKHDGSYETLSFDDSNSHMFIAGMTGYGKTNFININLLNANLTQQDAEYWLIDLKGGSELVAFEYARLTEHFTGDLDMSIKLLNALVIRIKKRLYKQQLLRRERKPKAILKPIFCVIDEYPNILYRKDALDTLCYIARTARSVNVHLILTTQRSSHEYLPGILKCNLPATVCFATKSRADSEVALGKGDFSATLLQHKGRAILDTPSKRITVQVPYIEGEEIDNRQGLLDNAENRKSKSNDFTTNIFDIMS